MSCLSLVLTLGVVVVAFRRDARALLAVLFALAAGVALPALLLVAGSRAAAPRRVT